MKNKKGYTLIELLAILVIIGLILIVVIPVVTKLLTNNNQDKFENYLKAIEAGATVYADSKKDELGSSNDTGCIEINLSKLIELGHVKEYNDKELSCNGKVRINNNNGKISVTSQIGCEDKNGIEVLGNNSIENGNCIAYVQNNDELRSKLINNGVGNNGSIKTVDSKTYIKGNAPRNYVWYSGNLWRVVYYENDSIKLILDDIATIIPRHSYLSGISYPNSIVENWLSTTFFDSLYKPSDYLINTSWDVSPTNSFESIPDKSELLTGMVGLLNSYEVSMMGDFILDDYKWLLSDYNGTNIRLATSGGVANIVEENFAPSKYYAIRPAISMKSDVIVIAGDGSKSSPYILEGNSTNIASGTLINTRVCGEYVRLNNILFRISDTSLGVAKIVMVDSLPNRQYSSSDFKYSKSLVSKYLNETWFINSLGSDWTLVIDDSSWCAKDIGNTDEFANLKTCSDKVLLPVGLPSLGDLYAVNNDGKSDEFWTIDYSSDDTDLIVHVIKNDTKSGNYMDIYAKVKPVMYLKSNVIIESGRGTIDEPFILGTN